jgi:DNA uptake protein ComE-like DNA-binding protein
MASRLGNRIEGEFLEAPVSLETRVVELENKFESEIKTLSKILSLVLQWIRNYQPVLDEAVKDYTDKLGRIKNLDKKD